MKNPKIFDWEEKIVTDIEGVGEKREWIKHTGINLLDYFAGQALIGILSNNQYLKLLRIGIGDGHITDEVNELSYDFAEAMLKEREKRNV